MDDTAQDTGEQDAFAQLLAQLNPPTTEPVTGPSGEIMARHAASFEQFGGSPAHLAPPPLTTGPTDAAFPAPFVVSGHPTRAPELMGADELAAEPHPFPPRPVAATPLIAPPLPSAPPPVASTSQASLVAPSAPPPSASSAASSLASMPPAVAQTDFALLLTAPVPAPSGTGSNSSSPFGIGTAGSDEPDIGRSTVGEKLTLLLAILLPPLGLLTGIIAAILSAQRRGWVIGMLRAAIAIGVILSVIAGIGGYIGFTALQQQQAHDRTAAASAAFCSTIKADPPMIHPPTFGWPAVATTISDSLAAMTAYQAKWTALAKASPPGIRSEVIKIATAATQIINSVTVGRTVDDAANIAVMTSAASASGVPGWYAEYCE